MGSQMEIVKDSEGNNHIIFDESSLYDDSKMGDNLSDFEVLQVLNENNKNSLFVSKVRSLNNHKIYAMKIIEFNKLENNLEKCMEVMAKLQQLNNPHIIKYYKAFKDNQNLYLIMEYMNNSDINGFIKAHQVLDKNIKEEEIWNILLQCLSAIEYLHQQKLGQYGIRLTNIFMNNEQNAKIGVFTDISHIINNLGEDVNLLGKYFYIMCYSQTPELKKYEKSIIRLDDINYNIRNTKDYSKELMEIIYNMIDQKFDSTTFYNNVKNLYVKKYARNSSIEAVLRCLYSYSVMNKFILNRADEIRKNKENKYINYLYLEAISAFSGEKENILPECIVELRHAIESENPKLDGNREIDPIYLLAFLLEKMHKELNKVDQNKAIPNEGKNYVINSVFNGEEEDKSNKEQMLYKFVNFFSANVNSIISDLFFGFLKTKRNCETCKTGKYSFSNYCFAAFDLSENKNPIFDIMEDGFHYQHKYGKRLDPDKPDRVYCERCLTYQTHLEFNRYYSMNYQLVISLIRGNNFQNNTKINFTEHLDLSPYVDEKLTISCKYYLVGAINRFVSDGKEEFIYWARDPDNINLWHSNKGDLQEAPINDIQSTGQVIILFYNNYDNVSK